MKRLRMLRSIHEQPTALRRGLGLKRRKMTRSQKFVRFLATR
ncbi:hypothetical protein [Henriciella aquimarina]|nr:hypothetical protein [Henriciella aquimarina]